MRRVQRFDNLRDKVASTVLVTLIVSSSLDTSSRSERLAQEYRNALAAKAVDVRLISLKEYVLPRFDNSPKLANDPTFQQLHRSVAEADGLVLTSPVYNWGCCSELKRFLEIIGTTPPDGSLTGAFYDKVVTFVNAGGLPHSYMAISPIAISMMFDFKCIINPYNVYVHNRHWEGENLGNKAMNRIEKSSAVMVDLMTCLEQRSYRSGWEI